MLLAKAVDVLVPAASQRSTRYKSAWRLFTPCICCSTWWAGGIWLAFDLFASISLTVCLYVHIDLEFKLYMLIMSCVFLCRPKHPHIYDELLESWEQQQTGQ